MADANPTVSFGTIYTRGKRNTYYFQSKKHGVRQTSLKTTDPGEALERTLEFFGHLQFQDQEKQYEKLIEEHELTTDKIKSAKRKNSLALVQIKDEYVKALKRIGPTRKKLHVDASGKSPLSPTTLKSSLGIVRQFTTWLSKNHSDIATMADVTTEVADMYFDHVRDKRSANTFNNHLSSLHVVWERLAIKGGLDNSPFAAITRLPQVVARSEMFSKRPFSLEQLQIFFEKAAETRWQPFCRIAYETGLRLGDIASILVTDIDLEGGYIDLRSLPPASRLPCGTDLSTGRGPHRRDSGDLKTAGLPRPLSQRGKGGVWSNSAKSVFFSYRTGKTRLHVWKIEM